ncbi:polyamine-modulated factor 1-like, partial [Corvus kubaryi]|uniref:polyamine-modulated factor 1-like n=1 Tax=Corvus kubaryi TaxID=68294 RepID=UPI001C057955
AVWGCVGALWGCVGQCGALWGWCRPGSRPSGCPRSCCVRRRPSGIPEDDVRSAMVPYFLKHRSYLRRVLREKEEENRKVAESVLMGRDRIAELQQLIQARQQAWQAISKEQRELVMTFQEPQ